MEPERGRGCDQDWGRNRSRCLRRSARNASPRSAAEDALMPRRVSRPELCASANPSLPRGRSVCVCVFACAWSVKLYKGQRLRLSI